MIVIMVVMCGVAYVSGVDVVVMAVAMLMLMYCLQLRLARTHANNGICYLLVIGVTLAFASDMVGPSPQRGQAT